MKMEFFEAPLSGLEANLPRELGQILEGKDYILRTLGELERHDRATYQHHLNVAELSARIGPKIGLTAEETHLLVEAALIHDAGKLQVSREVLNKKEELTQEDWEEIRKHTNREFFEYVRYQGGLKVAKIAVAHHDYGESRNKTREIKDRRQGPESSFDIYNDVERRSCADRRQIDLQAIGLSVILNIIDKFESLRSKERAYKQEMTPGECVEILKKEFPGKEDGKILEALLEISK